MCLTKFVCEKWNVLDLNRLTGLYSMLIIGRGVMPQRVLCQKCGFVLYEGIELTPPDEIVQRFNGKCPNCGKKLLFNPTNVDVKSLG